MKKQFLPLVAFLLINGVVSAQTFYNNGAQIGVVGAQMIVKTGSGANDGTLENAGNGLFSNKGEVHIEGSFVNTSGIADGYSSNAGQYIVSKDWVNNAQFNADQSKVFLHGGNQLITGSNPTTFFDLICETPSTTKKQTLDANVAGALTLNNNELATQNNKMTVLNTSSSAIVVNGINDAFVSSTGVGKLVRKTNSTDEYLFPLGWNNSGLILKREISFTPTDASNHSYEARFAFNTLSTTTTTDDGYAISTKEQNIQNVNDKFYHLLSSADNTPASLAIFYDPNNDGQWASIARWQGSPQWEDLANANANATSPRVRMIRNNWTDNSNQPHALVKPVEGDDFAFPNVFAPGSTDPSIPAENRYFTIVNNLKKVVLDELLVFNRWGEVEFSSKRDGTDKWDGYYQGKLQQQGNYTFIAKVKKLNGESYAPISGNLALVW
jgi:hypothetical protein